MSTHQPSEFARFGVMIKAFPPGVVLRELFVCLFVAALSA